jgi:hypothetical protein
LVKSCRASTVVSFEPKLAAWVRRLVSAVWMLVSVVETLLLSWKPLPLMAVRPRPAALNLTP